MRATAILLALSVYGLSAPALAADDGKTGESRQAIKAEPQAAKPAHTGVRMQQGRVRTDSDLNTSKTRKLPGQRKYGNITLKRGVISRESLLGRRRALASLKRPVSTAGMAPGEAAYVKALQDWAAAHDACLQKLQQLRSEYQELKTQRADAAAAGDDVTRFDELLRRLEARMRTQGDICDADIMKLEKLMGSGERMRHTLSAISKSIHETAKGIINNAKS